MVAILAVTLLPSGLSAATASTAPTTVAQSRHTVDIAVIAPADSGSTAAAVISTTAAVSLVSKTGAYWKSQSNGQIASVTVNPAVKHINSKNLCQYTEGMWRDAALTFGHSDISYYRSTTAHHLVVFAPEGCGWDAQTGPTVGTANGGTIWMPIDDTNDLDHQGKLALLFGYTFGLQPSNAHICPGARVTEGRVDSRTGAFSDGCVDEVYGDVYDVMGATCWLYVNGDELVGNTKPNALNITQQIRLGVVPAGSVQTVQMNGSQPSTTTVTIQSTGSASGVRAVKAVDPATGKVYYVDFRGGTGQDAGSFYGTGLERTVKGADIGVRVLTLRADGTSVNLVTPDPSANNGYKLYLSAGQHLTTRSGGLSVTVKSLASGAATVTVTLRPAPAVTSSVPTITGTAKVGLTLTSSAGPWGPAGVTLTRQWYRSGAAIANATGSTYKLVAADRGKTMAVRVLGVKSGYASVAKMSKATVAVAAGTLVSPTPTISGTRRSGYTLTAVTGTWGPSPVTLTYRWYRSGVPIAGASGRTYTLVYADRWDTIKVRVTGMKTGYTGIGKFSASTVKIP